MSWRESREGENMKIADRCVEKEKQTSRFISQLLAYAKS